MSRLGQEAVVEQDSREIVAIHVMSGFDFDALEQASASDLVDEWAS
jgi:hypothetical protein